MKRKQSLKNTVLVWMLQFLWARLRQDKTVVGIPGQRDPQSVCEFYAPKRGQAPHLNICSGDGHYLCAGCTNLKPADD